MLGGSLISPLNILHERLPLVLNLTAFTGKVLFLGLTIMTVISWNTFIYLERFRYFKMIFICMLFMREETTLPNSISFSSNLT